LAVLGGHSVPVTGLAISHDGKHVATCGSDNCQIWRSDGRGAPTTLPATFIFVTFTHDDSEVVLLRRVDNGTEIVRFSLDGTRKHVLRYPEMVNRFLLLPDDTIVMGTRTKPIGDSPGDVVVFDGDRPRIIARHEIGGVRGLALHPDGRILSC